MEPNDIESNIYIDSSKEINDKSPKFKIADIARISRYNFFFTKNYVPNWSKQVICN